MQATGHFSNVRRAEYAGVCTHAEPIRVTQPPHQEGHPVKKLLIAAIAALFATATFAADDKAAAATPAAAPAADSAPAAEKPAKKHKKGKKEQKKDEAAPAAK